MEFKSAENLAGFCALRCRSTATAHDVRRSMFDSDRGPSDRFDGQLRASSYFISKMHSNYHFSQKHSWTCKCAKKTSKHNK